jgi:hypothetical protein
VPLLCRADYFCVCGYVCVVCVLCVLCCRSHLLHVRGVSAAHTGMAMATACNAIPTCTAALVLEARCRKVLCCCCCCLPARSCAACQPPLYCLYFVQPDGTVLCFRIFFSLWCITHLFIAYFLTTPHEACSTALVLQPSACDAPSR